MLDTLNDYEAEINRVLVGDFEPQTETDIRFDGTGTGEGTEYERPVFGSRDEEIAYRLRHLSVGIRRKLWNSPGLARDLAARADNEAERIELAHGAAGERVPRFLAGSSCGLTYPAIV